MSTTIDQRVVEMTFDNAQFERGVSQSISTLDRLKAALNLDGAGKSLENISDAGKTFNLDGMSSAVDKVSNKFSALETMATGALLRIGAQAEAAGAKFLKSLTTDNIAAGWGKYEKKTGSVATLVAQGYALEEVNEQLDRLNWYTDETSYNFTDMVDNISKFTASGQGLTESVDAMMGIANWAALSGQNATKASQAMYQLSQAISKGVLKYDDWKSVQNAGMDNVEFRKQAIQTAIDLGKVTKAGEDLYKVVGGKGTFSLSEMFTSDALSKQQWFDTDVMMDTFNKYSSAVNKIYEYIGEQESQGRYITASKAIEELGGNVDGFGIKAFKAAQEARSFTDVIASVQDAVSTGWMKTFELMFGNYKEATELWTDLANQLWEDFASGGENRNLALSAWKDLGGRDDFIDGLWNLYYSIKLVVDPIHEAFNSVFNLDDDEITGESSIVQVLLKVTRAFKDFTRFLGGDVNRYSQLKEIFEGVWTVVKLLGEAFTTVAHIVSPLLNPLMALGSKVLDLGVFISGLIKQFDEWIHSSSEVSAGVKAVYDAVKTFSDGLTNAINNISEYYDLFVLLGALLGNVVVAAFIDLKNYVVELLAPVREFINLHFGDAFERLGDAIAKFDLSAIIATIVEIVEKAKQIPIINTILSGLQTALFGIVAVIFFVGSTVYKAISGIVNAVKNGGITGLVEYLLGKLKDLGKAILDFFSNNFIVKKLQEVKNAITSFFSKDNLTNKFESLKKSIDELVQNSGLAQWFENLKALVTKLTDPFKKLGETTLEWIGNLTPSKIIMLAFAGSLVAMFLSIRKAFSSMKELATGATDFLTVLSGGTIGKKPNVLRDFALAIGVLAGSLALLAALPQEDLNNATKCLLELAAAVVVLEGLSIVAGKLGGASLGSGFENISQSILMLAGAIAIVTLSLKMMETLDTGGILQNIIYVGLIMAELATVAILMSRLSGGMLKGSITILSFAGATYLLVKALTLLDTMDPDELQPKVLALVEVMAALALLSYGVGHIGFFSAVGLITLVLALKVVLPMLNDLAGQKFDNIEKFIKANIEMITMLGALLAVIAVVEAFTGKGIQRFGVGVLMMSGAVFILSQVIKQLAELNPSDIKRGTVFITQCLGLFALLALVSFATKEAKFAKFALGLIPLVGCIAALVYIADYTGQLDSKSIANGTKAIWQILAMVAALELISGLAKNVGIGSTIALLLGIAGIIGTMALLAKLPEESIKQALSVVMSILIGLGVAMAASRGIRSANGSALISTIVMYGAVIAMFAMMIGSLQELAGHNKDQVKNAGTAMAETILALTGGMALMMLATRGTSKANLGSVLSFAAMAATVYFSLGPVLDALIELSKTNKEQVKEAADSLSTVILSLAGSIALMSVAGAIAGVGGLAGIGAIIGYIALMGAIVAALVKIDEQFGEGTVDKGLAMLTKLSTGLGEAFGGLFSGIASGAVSQLPEIGTSLSTFAENVGGFVSLFSSADFSAAATGIGSLADVFVKLAEGDFINTIVSKLGGDQTTLAEFGAQLTEFGTAMVNYSLIVSGVNADAITSSATAAAILVDLANTLPNSGGLLGQIFGENDWGTFTAGLVDFGTAMVNYSLIVAGVDSNAIEASSAAATMLVDLANTIPNSGGLLADLIGDNTWVTFAQGLVPFGNAMVAYAKVVSEGKLDENTFKASNAAATMLADLENSFPTTGGIISLFTGDASWTSFSDGLVEFGKAMVDYADSVAGIDGKAIEDSATAATSLATLSQSIPEGFGGLLSSIFGGDSWGNFGSGLASFGAGLLSYTNIIKTGKLTAADGVTIEASAKAAESLATLAQKLPNGFGGWLSQAFGGNGWGTFSANLVDFGGALIGYSNVLKTGSIDADLIQRSGVAAQAVVNVLKTIGEASLNGGVFGMDTTFGENYKQFGVNLQDFATSIQKYSANLAGIDWAAVQNSGNNLRVIFNLLKDLSSTEFGSLDSFNAALESLANVSLDSFISVFENPTSTEGTSITSAIDTMVSTATGEIDTKASTFKTSGEGCITEFVNGLNGSIATIKQAGADAVAGFIAGVNEHIGEISPVGASMGSELLSGLSAETGWESPWKTTIQAGSDAVEGLKQGVENNISVAEEAAETLGAKFVEAYRNSPMDWHSPPGPSVESGEDFDQGVADGTYNNMSVATNAAKSLGQQYVESAVSTITEGIKTTLPNTAKALDDLKNGYDTYKKSKESGKSTKDAVTDALKTNEDVWNLVHGLTGDAEEAADQAAAAAKEAEEGTKTTKNYTKATDDASKATSSGAKSTKEATEAAQKHEKAVKIQTKAISEFADRYGEAYQQLGETAALDAAKDAIHRLAVEYAEASGKTIESEADIEEAFVEMYENIEQSVSGSMDMFSRFSAGASMSSKELLANMHSNLDAAKQWSEGLQQLAARGFSKAIIESLSNEGLSSLSKINSFRKFSFDEMIEANALWDEKKDAAANAAIKALTAMAYAGETSAAVLAIASGQIGAAVSDIPAEIVDAYNEWTGDKLAIKNLGLIDDMSGELKEEITEVFGNIDLNNRQVLTWTEDTLDQFKDSIGDWVEDVESLPGTISTVLGSSSEYDGVEIAFSPMLQTESGPEVLSQATVDKYIFGLIEEAGENWSSEDLLRLDTEGLEIDGKKINNILADVGETAKRTGEAMHYLGENGSIHRNFELIRQAAEKSGKSLGDYLVEIQQVSKGSSLAAQRMEMEISARVDTINTRFGEIRESLKTTIADQIDIFSEFGKKTDLTIDQLIGNMDSNLSGVTEWANGLSVLLQRGLDEGLYDKLVQMGPEASYELVNALVQSNGEQLQQVNEKYQQSLALPQAIADQVSNQYLTTATNNLAKYIEGLTISQPQVTTATQNVIAYAATAAQTKVNEVTPGVGKTFSTMVGGAISQNSGEAEVGGRTLALNSATATKSEIEKDAPTSGAAMGPGVAAGIYASIDDATTAASAMGTAVVNAFNSSVGYASPWKTMIEAGRFANIGLAQGLEEYSNISVNAAQTLGSDTLDSFNAAVADFSTILGDDVDLDPSIRPTLDLTDVEAKSDLLSSMFDSRTMDIAGNINHVGSMNNRMLSALSAMQPGNNNNMSVGGITINTQPGQDPQEIANAVSNEIYRRMRSREAVMA